MVSHIDDDLVKQMLPTGKDCYALIRYMENENEFGGASVEGEHTLRRIKAMSMMPVVGG